MKAKILWQLWINRKWRFYFTILADEYVIVFDHSASKVNNYCEGRATRKT